MTEEKNLEETRAQIDEIDEKMAELFCRRMDLSADVSAFKLNHGMETYRPEREQEVLDKAASGVPEKYAEYIRRFFTGVMQISRDYQEELRAADARKETK